MKPFEYYKQNPHPYPSKRHFTTIYGYEGGKVKFKMNLGEYMDMVPANRPKASATEKVVDEVDFKLKLDAYNHEQNRLHMEFMNDIFEEFDVVDNPKRHKCFVMAYEHGHSAGHQEVYSWFQELVELIK
jgi:hypothetical protein